MTDWRTQALDDGALMADFLRLCDFGGRLAGSGSDSDAVDWAVGRLAEALGPVGRVRRQDIAFAGWHCIDARLASFASTRQWACMPLLRSANTAPEGLVAPVIDLGLGRPEDFDRLARDIPGRIVLVEHEYPFSPTHVHRRRKYDAAVAARAAGFLMANPWPDGGLMSGSSGRPPDGFGIPAAYVDWATGVALRESIRASRPEVRLTIVGEERPDARAGIVIADLPGGRPDWIVISAHIDGHPLGESALDNATGVAVAIAAARTLAARVGRETPGLRICLFNAEEWALTGSARYLEALPEHERQLIRLNINLDTVAGDNHLTALTSGFRGLEPFLLDCAERAGIDLSIWSPLMSNSDHANFARHGIPAFRLVAGFDRPQSRVRAILSSDDRREAVNHEELVTALGLTCTIAVQALGLSNEAMSRLGQ